MKRVTLISIMSILLIFLWVSLGHANPKKRFDEGTQTCRVFTVDSAWWGEGAKVFKRNCKSCHFRGNEQGAPFLHSESKPPRGWNRVFFKKYPKCAKDGSWADLTLEDQLVLNDYLFRNGADTYDPNDAESCG